MERTRMIALIIALLIIVGGMFAFVHYQKRELTSPAPQDDPVMEDRDESPLRLTAKHFFIDGTHTIAGEIVLPTPCHALDWDVLILESFPEQVVIQFTTSSSAEMCAQVITPQRFKVPFVASEDATIRATLDGRPVELNLVPAEAGEDPDDFEIYIKG